MATESSTNNYDLKINSEEIKYYIGVLIKKVIVPSKKKYIEDNPKTEWSDINIRVHIEETDGTVTGSWNDVDDIDMIKLNIILKSNLEKAKSSIKSKKVNTKGKENTKGKKEITKKKKEKQRYFFTINMD